MEKKRRVPKSVGKAEGAAGVRPGVPLSGGRKGLSLRRGPSFGSSGAPVREGTSGGRPSAPSRRGNKQKADLLFPQPDGRGGGMGPGGGRPGRGDFFRPSFPPARGKAHPRPGLLPGRGHRPEAVFRHPQGLWLPAFPGDCHPLLPGPSAEYRRNGRTAQKRGLRPLRGPALRPDYPLVRRKRRLGCGQGQRPAGRAGRKNLPLLMSGG